MVFVGSEEFNQYINADMELRELEYEQKLAIHRIYADIHPTRAEYNYDTGKIYKVNQDVAEYAIAVIEMKEIQKEMRDRYVKRLEIYNLAIQVLNVKEMYVLNEYKRSLPVADHLLLRATFKKLKTEIERLLTTEERKEKARIQAEKDRKIALIQANTELFNQNSVAKGIKQHVLVDGRFEYVINNEFAEV